MLGVWREMSDDDVYRRLLPFSLARTGLQYAAGAVLGMGSGTTSLLDTTPLRRAAAYELPTGRPELRKGFHQVDQVVQLPLDAIQTSTHGVETVRHSRQDA